MTLNRKRSIVVEIDRIGDNIIRSSSYYGGRDRQIIEYGYRVMNAQANEDRAPFYAIRQRCAEVQS